MGVEILIADDEPGVRESLAEVLRDAGYEVETASDGSAALRAIEAKDFAVVVTDIRMPGADGLAVLRRAREVSPQTVVMVMTAHASIETAVEALRAGAADYVLKPVLFDDLLAKVERILEHRELVWQTQMLRREIEQHVDLDLVGKSPAMREVGKLLGKVSPTQSTVLITGESGTGKEVVARALHRHGRRAAGPFVAINCAAMPEPLLESELFGHARGAFTDARTARTGLFVEASGGTLFLDEIGELPLGLQPKLLRALQERVVRPIGGAREVPFDVRLVVATNRDLEAAIAEKRFREDLYFRVNVLHVELPPLRARGADALLLAQHFLRQFADKAGRPLKGISSAAAERLLAYDWPGNVRELMNCIERAVALARFDELAVDDLPEKIRRHRASHVLVTGDDPTELVPLEEVERRYILRVLQAVSNNKRLAARVLGVDRKTLYRKLERYGVLAG